LSATDSAEPGQWRTSRTPYLREPMDALSPMNPAERVVFEAGAQLGKTQMGNNWIGYTIHRSPVPMLIVLPTVEVAKRISKQRIAPMIEATPSLRGLVREARSRDSGNTVQVKQFRGGILIITGANSPTGLRSMPIARLFCDEVDEYPGDVGGQGDPVMLAEKRTSTFPNRKSYLCSTPTLKGLSRIEAEFNASDQRRYFVPCPNCGHMDWLRWENMRWSSGEPDTIRLLCAACLTLIEERHKTDMLARGEWRATAEGGTARVAGFHLSSLYSPLGWKSWSACCAEFLLAKDEPLKLKTWVNTVLAETWEERGDSIEVSDLKARVEHFEADVPDGVGVLVAAVDVQGDRLEAIVKGYGAGEQSWLVAFTQLFGDPGELQVWQDLDGFLAQEFEHASGQKVPITATVIDSGGHHTEEVYRYCSTRRRRVAIKGGPVAGRPLVERPSIHNRYRIPLYVLCTDTGKETVLSRLRAKLPGPGFIHLPDWADDEYLAQLTAERALRKYVRGRGTVRHWVKTRERNEALDLEVYALAALYILGAALVRSLPERAAALSVRPEATPGAQGSGAIAPEARQSPREQGIPPPEGVPSNDARPRLRRRGGWMNWGR
jgi:phage terminase large subunit GpA-like protein